MNKKTLMISACVIAALYAVIGLLGIVVFHAVQSAHISSVLFTGVLFVIAALLDLPEKKKGFRIALYIIAMVELLAALYFSIDIFSGILPDEAIFVGALLAAVVAAFGFVLVLIRFAKASVLVQISSAVSAAVLTSLAAVLAVAAYPGNLLFSKILCVSIAMASCAAAINLAALSLGKMAQNIMGAGALVFLVLPVVYIVRGYWGFSGGAINALGVISLLVMLVCMVIAAVFGMKQPKPAPEPAAPAAPAAWVCPQCGKTDNTAAFCEECGFKKN